MPDTVLHMILSSAHLILPRAQWFGICISQAKLSYVVITNNYQISVVCFSLMLYVHCRSIGILSHTVLPQEADSERSSHLECLRFHVREQERTNHMFTHKGFHMEITQSLSSHFMAIPDLTWARKRCLVTCLKEGNQHIAGQLWGYHSILLLTALCRWGNRRTERLSCPMLQ